MVSFLPFLPPSFPSSLSPFLLPSLSPLLPFFLPFKLIISWQTPGFNRENMLLSITLGVIQFILWAAPSYSHVVRLFTILKERNKLWFGQNNLMHLWMQETPMTRISASTGALGGTWSPIPNSVTNLPLASPVVLPDYLGPLTPQTCFLASNDFSLSWPRKYSLLTCYIF